MKRLTQTSKGQMVTGSLQFYHLRTPVSIVPTADQTSDSADEQRNYYTQTRVWEKIIEVLRTRANPVIIGQLEDDGFSFAVEHAGIVDGAALQGTIRALGTVPFSHTEDTTVDLSGVVVLAQDGLRLAVAETGVSGTQGLAGVLTNDGYETVAPTAGDPYSDDAGVITPTNLGSTHTVESDNADSLSTDDSTVSGGDAAGTVDGTSTGEPVSTPEDDTNTGA